MNIGGLRVGRLTDGECDQLLRSARSSEPTYDHIGSTLDPQLWQMPEVHTHRVDVGHGARAFIAARVALQSWVPQRAIGAQVIPDDQLVALGATVLLVLRRGPFLVVVPDRVVDVIDEPRHYAYAYGTLPGHPERGEESFTVEHLTDDTVRVTIRVQAGPGTLAAKVVAPIVRHLQAAALRRYLRAVADHVAESSRVMTRTDGTEQ